jgi:4'-phosphopantetheinyl transferase
MSAERSNLSIDFFEKDGSGIPLPSRGIYWSVSHKPGFVAGVVSDKRVGIDLEEIKDVSHALFRRILDSDEQSLFQGQDPGIVFFRAFTAKEAVLKITNIGIRGLSKTRITSVVDDTNMQVQYSGQNYWIENFYFDGALASVTKDHCDVQWNLG